MRKMSRMSKLLVALLSLALVCTMVPQIGFAEDLNGNATAGDVAAAAQTDVTSLKLDKPEIQTKPEVRWWLAQGAHTDETIKESVKEIADSGFGGIEFAMLNDTNVNASKFAYGSPEWVNDVKLIIQECTKYGLSASFTSGTHWATANIPGMDPNSEGANHEVAEAHASVVNGSTYNGLPKPTTNAAVNQQTLVSAVAYKLTGTFTASPTINSPLLLDQDSMVDLTDDALDNGTISFTASGGNWVIFTFWYRGTGNASTPATQPSYAINYFDHAGFDALKTYWESYLFGDEEIVSAIKKNGKVQMFMDSLEISNSQGGSYSNNSLFWTKDMKEKFLDMKGYDITPYLPVFLGTPSMFGVNQPSTGTVGFAGSAGATFRTKVLDDLRDVQTQLYMTELIVPLKKWLNDNYNIKLRAQISYGKYLEVSQPITVVDYPETETRNQRDQTDVYRVWAGGTHLQNKILSSETSAHDGMNYGYSLQEYLQQNYTQYAGGVSRVIWHGYSSIWGPRNYNTNAFTVRWPGYEAGMNAINGRWGTRNPSYKDYNEYNDHLGRLQTVLRAGVPQVDLAILYSDYAYQLPKRTFTPDEDMGDLKQQKHEGWQWKDLTLQDAGYTYDYFAPQYLDGGYAKYDKAKGLLASDGPAYQAVLVNQEKIPLESAQALLAMAKDGLKVILVQGAMTKTSWNDGKESALAAIRSQLLSLDNVQQVANEKSAYDALQQMNVEPRAEYRYADKELLSVTRKDNDATYLFLYNYYNVMKGWNDFPNFTSATNFGSVSNFSKNNSWDQENDENIVEVKGNLKPYILNTWTGEITEVAEYKYQDGKTLVPINIPDGDVKVYIFKNASDTGLRVTSTDASQVMLSNGKFTVRSTESGKNYVRLSDGKKYSADTAVPKPQTLKDWNVNVESWDAGAESTPRVETTVFGNMTTESSILTKKTDIKFNLKNLTTWNNIASVGKTVSGIGTYKTTFDWDKSGANGAYLDLGDIVESATVFVNGKKTQDVNLIDAVVDIPNSMLVEGENTLEIVVTTPLSNTVLKNGWNGAALTEGAYRGGGGAVGNLIADHVFTYFDNGLPQAILTPYVDTVVYDSATPPQATPPAINPPILINAADTAIAPINDQQYTGKQIKPVTKVTVGGKALVLNTDYTVVYGANVNIGNGTATVTGKGDYADSKTVTFKIIPTKTSIKKIKAGKKKANVAWRAVSSAQKVTGYQVQYRVKGTAKWSNKSVSAKKSSLTITKLNKGKKYQVRVRAYKKVSGTNYYARWSSVKISAKVK